jgi:hypothetical protein
LTDLSAADLSASAASRDACARSSCMVSFRPRHRCGGKACACSPAARGLDRAVLERCRRCSGGVGAQREQMLVLFLAVSHTTLAANTCMRARDRFTAVCKFWRSDALTCPPARGNARLGQCSPRPACRRTSRHRAPPTAAHLLAAQLDLVPRALPGVPSSLTRRALRGGRAAGMVRCRGSASVEIGARSCTLAVPRPAPAAAAAAAAAASLPVAVRAGGRARAGWLAECSSHGKGQHGHLCVKKNGRYIRPASRSTPANWPREAGRGRRPALGQP